MHVIRGVLTLLACASLASIGVGRILQDQNSAEAKARTAMVGKLAPELAVNQWINTNGKAYTLKELRGKVVVLDFFTYW